MEKKTIGAFIAVLRKANGLTQRQLAEMLNVSDKAISRWERDEALPDLTMIPVLADIFGVTADELLRGQRNINDTPPPQAQEKSKKQLQYLLNKTATRYQVFSLLSVMAAVLGVLAAAFSMLSTGISLMGFLSSGKFFLAALVMQIVSHIIALSKLNVEEFDRAVLDECRAKLLRRSLWSYSLILLLFLFTLPLGLGGLQGIGLRSWLLLGLIFVAAGAVVCGLLCAYIYFKHARAAKHSACQRLQRRIIIATIAALLITLLAQGGLALLFQSNPQWFGTATVHRNFEAFRALMEAPPEGWSFSREAGEHWNRIRFYIDTDGYEVPVYSSQLTWNGVYQDYFHANKDIVRFTQSSNRLYTFTAQQYADAQSRGIAVMLALLLLYPAEIAAGVLIYRKKAAKLPAAKP